MSIDINQKITWKEMLETYISEEKQKGNKNIEKSTEDKEREIYNDVMEYLELNQQDIKPKQQKTIPKFYYKNPLIINDIQLAIKSEAKQRFLMTYSNEIPEKSKLKEVWFCLKNNKSQPYDNTERINYDDYVKVGNQFGKRFKTLFSPLNFLKFDKDKYGRIEIIAFFHYLVKKTTALENKILISYHDFFNQGILTDRDIENYIKEEFKSFYFYNETTEDLREYYLLVAQRKFFFFLDLKRTGKIQINDLVSSTILSDFLEMKEKSIQSDSSNSNWFSKSNFLRIYRKYIDLDKDKNGMLSKDELIKFDPGLTQIFIDRIFEEYQKYENAIDFKQFIDFCLAMEYKKSLPAINYFWKVIDVNHNNKVDTFVINMFFRQVVKKLSNRNRDEYKVDDIKDEIWDMVKPKNKEYLSIEDVLKSSNSEIILPLLFDAKVFLFYDQKESFLVEEFEEIEEEHL